MKLSKLGFLLTTRFWVGLILISIGVSIATTKWHPLRVIAGGLLAFGGVGLWLRQSWAFRTVPFLFLGSAGIHLYVVATKGIPARNLLLAVCFLWIAWNLWSERRESERPDPKEDDTDEPPMSIVLFCREPRTLDAELLARAASSAWGGEYLPAAKSESGRPRVVVGEAPHFVILSPDAVYAVHCVDRPYFDDPAKAAADIPEVRRRRAIEQHRAWISVDLIRAHDPSLPPQSFYPAIGRLAAELADEDVLAIFHPESGRLAPWIPDLQDRLRGPDPLAAFVDGAEPPVLCVHADDPRMKTAVEEARRRWPEFVAAFQAKAGEHFSIKAPIASGDRTEFIWIDVVGLEPECIHGALANDPVDLGGLKLGDRVEVPLKDLNDWCVVRGQEVTGLFTMKPVAEAQGKDAPEA